VSAAGALPDSTFPAARRRSDARVSEGSHALSRRWIGAQLAAGAAVVVAYSLYHYREALLTFFFFDDFWAMHDAASIRLDSIDGVLAFFRPGHAGFGLYRPLTTVMYSYVLHALCGYDASAQHAVQLLIFSANVALAYAITYGVSRSVVAATAAGLIYTVAPGQAINAYWVAQFTVTGTAFWLLTMMACWLFAPPTWRLGLCTTAQIVALLCSEHGVTGPVLLAILAAMRRERLRPAAVAIAPSVALVALYLAAKLYYFEVLRPPVAVIILATRGLTLDVSIWLQHLGQYLIQCFTPLALWNLSDGTAVLLGGGIVVALGIAAWRAYRVGGAWMLVAGGLAVFVATLAPVFAQRSRFGCVYIGVAVLGVAWALIGGCQLISRHGSLLALALALALLVVDAQSGEQAWRSTADFRLIINGGLASVRWMEAARQAALEHHEDVVVPKDAQTTTLFVMGMVQTFFPEMPSRVTLYDPLLPYQAPVGQVVVNDPAALTRPEGFPGAQSRWDWLRRFVVPGDGPVRLGANHEFEAPGRH
jgi:hypothetical protein